MLTAVAHVFDHAHTGPEVVVGWLPGAAIAALFVRALTRSKARMFRPAVTAAGLLTGTTVAYGYNAPIQATIDKYSPGVCARAMAGVASFFRLIRRVAITRNYSRRNSREGNACSESGGILGAVSEKLPGGEACGEPIAIE